MYVEHDFYILNYHGDSIISPDDWYRYEARAEAQLARYKRIYSVFSTDENAEAMAICAMADALFFFDAAASGEAVQMQSASIGSVSVSYAGANAVDISPMAQAKELYRCACLYLNIYRG